MNDENIRTQYSELNYRSRWYASQAWQVPFAYIGLSALLLSLFSDTKLYMSVIFILSAFLGVFVIIHLCNIFERIKRTVNGMMKIEKELNLLEISEYKSIIHGSFLILFIIVLVIFLIFGFYFAYVEICLER